MPWRGPEFEGEYPTLGPQVAQFLTELPSPDQALLDDGTRAPFVVSDAQFRILCEGFRIRESAWDRWEPGDLWRSSNTWYVEDAKGTGKSPLGAGLGPAGLLGPVVFDGFDANGEPVGRPETLPNIPVVASSVDQAGNVYDVMLWMLQDDNEGRGSSFADRWNVEAGLGLCRLRGNPRAKIEAVTAAARSRVGAPYTMVICDETWLWLPATGGWELFKALQDNADKNDALTIALTNAPILGERSVSEQLRELIEAERETLPPDRWRTYSYAPTPSNAEELREWADTDDGLGSPEAEEALWQGFRDIYTASPWVNIGRQVEAAQAPGADDDRTLRVKLNIATSGKGRAWSPSAIRALREDAPSVLEAGTSVVLGFDGAISGDSVALVAWTLDDAPALFDLKIWTRPRAAQPGFRFPRGEFKAEVRAAMDRFDVILLGYDSGFHELDTLYDEWLDEYGEPNIEKGTPGVIGYPTNSLQRFDGAIRSILEDATGPDGPAWRFSGSDLLASHFTNAVLGTSGGRGYRVLSKPKDVLKIDGCVAATLSYDLIASARLILKNRKAKPRPFILA